MFLIFIHINACSYNSSIRHHGQVSHIMGSFNYTTLIAKQVLTMCQALF